jgi:two-component system nitrogen regulation response regulator GlnG
MATVTAKPSLRVPRVLLIDDDPMVQRIGQQVFAAPGYSFFSAGTAAEGLSQISRQRPDVVILDRVLPDQDGLAVLDQIRSIDPHLLVLFITVMGTSLSTIEAMKRGAFDFLAKPLDVVALQRQVSRALETRRLMLTPVELQAEGGVPSAEVLVGNSIAMRETYKSIGRVAAQDLPVLIVGERGTGKELVARLIHKNGPRSRKPLHTVNCRDFSGPWLESELFGHEAESFAGADSRRSGRLEAAEGGVLLLKEIGDLPLSTQSKLVRLLRERTYERPGGSVRTADLTILATSSDDLERAVAEGCFQSELFYALGAFTIRLPPLRERRDDIPLLVDHIIKHFAGIRQTLGGELTRVSEAALGILSRYDWPGNVDELQCVLKRALIEGKGAVLATENLARALGQAGTTASSVDQQGHAIDWSCFLQAELETGSTSVYAHATAALEKHLLPLALAACEGSQVKAAHCLGMTRGSLRKKLRQLGLLSTPGSPEEDPGAGDDQQGAARQ